MTEMKPAEIQIRLLYIVKELEQQTEVAATYSTTSLPFAAEMSQIREFATLAGEYGLAYESLVEAIQSHPFVLSCPGRLRSHSWNWALSSDSRQSWQWIVNSIDEITYRIKLMALD